MRLSTPSSSRPFSHPIQSISTRKNVEKPTFLQIRKFAVKSMGPTRPSGSLPLPLLASFPSPPAASFSPVQTLLLIIYKVDLRENPRPSSSRTPLSIERQPSSHSPLNASSFLPRLLLYSGHPTHSTKTPAKKRILSSLSFSRYQYPASTFRHALSCVPSPPLSPPLAAS